MEKIFPQKFPQIFSAMNKELFRMENLYANGRIGVVCECLKRIVTKTSTLGDLLHLTG
jgi:hypothetical protein